MSSLISVIIPVYNAEKYLQQTIDSVLLQSHRNIEIIFINDGSSDDSEEIILTNNDARIRYLKQENKGQAAASNLGISVSKGDCIKFLDADDIINTNHLEEQVKILDGIDNAVASCAWGRFYDGDPLSAKFNPEAVWKNMLPLDWLQTSLKQPEDMMPAWLWLIPRTILQRAGGWDERLSLNNDFEFSTRLLLHSNEVRFAGNARVYYRSAVASSLSVINTKNAYSAALLSTQLGCGYLLKADNSLEMRLLCANRYRQWIYRMYPRYRNLAKEFEKEIEKLGGSDLLLEGSRTIQIFRRVFGWKAARFLQFYYYKLRYK